MRHYPLISDLSPYRFTGTRFSFPETMKTDIRETEDHYEFSIEVPGAKKEDIKIELKDKYLIVEVEKDSIKEEKDKDGRIVYRERKTGKQSRTFALTGTHKQEDIQASFKDGLLVIKVPKESKKEESKKYISIE